MDAISKIPRLVASTKELYNCTISESKLRAQKLQSEAPDSSQNLAPDVENWEFLESNYFKSAQW